MRATGIVRRIDDLGRVAVSYTHLELFPCKTYVYLWRGNPLAKKEKITFEDLEEYPCPVSYTHLAARPLSDLLNDIDTVNVRKSQIQKDDIRTLGRDDLKSCFAGIRREDFIIMVG